MQKTEDLRGLMRMSLISMAWSVPIYVIVLVFRPSMYWFIALLCSVVLLQAAYSRIKNKAPFKPFKVGKKLLQACVFGFLIYYLSHFFGAYGLAGYVVFVLLLSGFVIWRRRDIYLQAIRTIETRLFGKPLDRSSWNGQKPIVPKIRIRKKRGDRDG